MNIHHYRVRSKQLPVRVKTSINTSEGRNITGSGGYSKPISLKLVVLIAGLLTALKLGAGVVVAFHGALGLWLLLGVRHAIQALSLAVVIKYLNPVLYSYPAGVGVMGWVIILLGGFRMLLGSKIGNVKVIFPILGFSLVVAALFIVQDNKAPAVSAMKLVLFTYVSCAVVLGGTSLSERQALELATWFHSLIATLVLLSLPLFAFPDIAYAKNGEGFQGILNHPQTFGPIFAPVTSALLVYIFFGKPTKYLFIFAVILLLISLMIASQARTALATVTLSILATALVVFFKKKRFSQFRFGRFFIVSSLTLIALLVSIVSSSVVQEKLEAYVYKRGSTDVESALASRSMGIAAQWNYFVNHPLTGCGFGVYPWGLGRPDSNSPAVIEFMGLPISAPVEKGFLPTSILEETGLLGGLSFFGVLIYMTRRVIARQNIQWLAIFFSCIFVNVGEMGIFSVGGIGLFYWLLIGVSSSVPSDQETGQNDLVSARMRQQSY